MTLKLIQGAYFKAAAIALAALMAVGALGSWAVAFSASRQVKSALVISEAALAPPKAKTEKAEPAETESKEEGARPGKGGKRGGKPAKKVADAGNELPEDLAKLIKDKGLFGKPSMQVVVQGVLGNKALINGQWIAVGEEQNGVKLVELDSKNAVMEVFGERREMPVWAPLQGMVPTGPSRGSSSWGRREGDRGKGWPSFSPAQRDEMRRRYESMSDAEKKAAREKFRQQYQQGGGFGGFGGGNGMGNSNRDDRRRKSDADRAEKKRIR